LRGLEKKGLVRRVADKNDSRRVNLYPTDAAHENLARLRDIWSRLLDGIIDDPQTIDDLNSTLRHIETTLGARARQGPGRASTL
jgi:DNA-binding MarR family transcriptional regulator